MALHRRLKTRAAMAGMSLSNYLLAEIKEIAEKPGERYRSALKRREKSARRDDRPGCACLVLVTNW